MVDGWDEHDAVKGLMSLANKGDERPMTPPPRQETVQRIDYESPDHTRHVSVLCKGTKRPRDDLILVLYDAGDQEMAVPFIRGEDPSRFLWRRRRRDERRRGRARPSAGGQADPVISRRRRFRGLGARKGNSSRATGWCSERSIASPFAGGASRALLAPPPAPDASSVSLGALELGALERSASLESMANGRRAAGSCA